MFTYHNFVYLKPMYTVQAYRKEELPEAFSQLEKLRRSGFLAGYFRRAALFPDEHMIPEEPDTPLLKFFLFRTRKQMEEASAPRVFCPTAAPLHNSLHQLYAVAGTKDTPFARDLGTRCAGQDIFASLAPSFPCGGYYKDAFEEVIALCDHQTVDIDLKDEAAAKEASARTIEELLKSSFSGDELFGVGCIAREFISFHGASALMVRHGQEDVFCCAIRKQEQDPAEVLKDICLPKDAAFGTCTRLEDGAAFLLKDHLEQLKETAQAHMVPTDSIDALGSQIHPAAPRDLPGCLSDFKVSFENAWSTLPSSWEKSLTEQGALPSSKPLALQIHLSAKGELAVSAAPAAEGTDTLGYVRQALDERSDLLQLDLNTPLACEESAGRHIQQGDWQDALVVNRFAVVCGCTNSEIVFKQGTKLLTPPADAGSRNDVLRTLLLKKHVLEERASSLPQVLSSEELYCVSSVFGARKAVKLDPAKL